MAASKEVVEGLHAALAKAFQNILDEGIKALDADGNPVTVTAPANYLNVIRQFIKDNDVQALALPGSAMGNLVTKLPFAGTEDGDLRH